MLLFVFLSLPQNPKSFDLVQLGNRACEQGFRRKSGLFIYSLLCYFEGLAVHDLRLLHTAFNERRGSIVPYIVLI